MPALSTLTVCDNVPGTNSFTSSITNLEALPGAPSWFSFELIGIDIITGEAYYTYSVSPNNDIGTNQIDLTDGYYINVIITDCEHEVYYICIGESVTGQLTPPDGGELWEIYQDSTRVDFALGEDYDSQTWEVLGELEGDAYIVLNGDLDPSVYKVIQFVVSNCYNAFDECSQGLGQNNINIVWLNGYGGWNSYVFFGKKVIGKDIGESKVIKSSTSVLKKISIDNVYDRTFTPSGWIPESHQDFVEGLKYTIQAYEWDSMEGTFTPIIIDADSFDLRKEGNGLVKYDFSFRYATEIKVQNQ